MLLQGLTPDEVAEIIENLAHGLAAEGHIMPPNLHAEALADFAAGTAGSSPEAAKSRAIQVAAETVSKDSSSTQEITEALFKAGVPGKAIHAASQAVSNAVQAAGRGELGKPAFDAALHIIANAVTPAGQAAALAASKAANGARGGNLNAALSAAGVPAAALEATSGLVFQAIRAASHAGTDLEVGEIGVISSVSSSAGLAAAVAISGPFSERLASALRFAGVAPGAIDATAKAIADAVSKAGGSNAGGSGSTSASRALVAATNIIANAANSAFESWSMTVYAPPSSPAQAILDVIGASYNFWYLLPGVIWQTVKALEGKADSETLAKILAHGPPPTMEPYRDIVVPYRRAGNPFPGFPPLVGDGGNGTRPTEPGLNCTQPGTGGTPESEKADNKFVADAVKSFKHDKAKYLKYLKTIQMSFIRLKRLLKARLADWGGP